MLSSRLRRAWCCSHPAIVPRVVLRSLPLHRAWCRGCCCCATHGAAVAAIALGMVSRSLSLRRAWFAVVVSQSQLLRCVVSLRSVVGPRQALEGEDDGASVGEENG
jgi:hypothetical protein